MFKFLTIVLLLTTAPPVGDATKPLDAREAARTMIVPEGFNVTLFAGEPDVRQPIAFCIDGRGRLWVAEAYSYPDRKAESKDRIVILEDTDGDGRADKRTVFYDKLNYVSGIEVGFGGAWVMSPPFFYFIADRDGDDKPDRVPQVLLDGFGAHANAHNMANGFAWGPDGWLYGCHGRTNWSKIGPPRTPDHERVVFDGGLYRYHPVLHMWEPFADGTTNPWGVDFDDYGQAFVSNCVNPHLFHMIQGAHYEPWRGRKSSQFAYERIPTIADHLHWVGKNAGDSEGGAPEQLALGGGHAHSGTMIYLGDNWPDRYRNTAFMCNIHGKRVNNDILRRQGSGYTASHGKDVMISRDPWFMGVTLCYGPDGAVYVSDWSDTGECHSTKNTRRETGRIFKITYGNPKHKTVDVARLSDRELVELQLHKNDWYVRHARRVLQERAAAKRDVLKRDADDEVTDRLLDILKNNKDVTRKLRAIWALHAMFGDELYPVLLELLDHPNEYVRAWAVRLLTDPAPPGDKAVKRFAELARDDRSPFVRLHLASALQRMSPNDRWAVIEGLIAREEDIDDANLPLMTWYGIEPLVKLDSARAAALLPKAKSPLIRQFIARRAAE
jgi:putative membrane-bound dehydrogenase-like protein